MPAVYAFAEKRTAELAKERATAPILLPESVTADDIVGWILLTAAEGIPANTDPDSSTENKEIPSALCKTWALVESGGKIYRRQVKNADGSQLEVRAGNMGGEPIDGNKFIRATRVVGGAFLVDYAPCS